MSFNGQDSFSSGELLLNLIADDRCEAILLLLEPSRAIFEAALHAVLQILEARLLELSSVVCFVLVFLLDSPFELLGAAGAKFRSEVSPFFIVLETAISCLLADVGGGTSNEMESWQAKSPG